MSFSVFIWWNIFINKAKSEWITMQSVKRNLNKRKSLYWSWQRMANNSNVNESEKSFVNEFGWIWNAKKTVPSIARSTNNVLHWYSWPNRLFWLPKISDKTLDNNTNNGICYWHELSTWDLSLPIIMRCAKITSFWRMLDPDRNYLPCQRDNTKEYEKRTCHNEANSTKSIVKCKQSTKPCTNRTNKRTTEYIYVYNAALNKAYVCGWVSHGRGMERGKGHGKGNWAYAKVTISLNNLQVHVLRYHAYELLSSNTCHTSMCLLPCAR